MRPRVRTVLIFLLTLGLLGFFFRNADMAGVWTETRRARPGLLALAVCVTGLTYALRAFRWQYLLARVKAGGLLAAVAAVAALGVLFALAGHPERMGRAALRVERVLPARLAHALAKFVETFAQGLAVMRQPRRLMISLVLSVPLWLSIAAGIWLCSLAFHITFPYTGSFLVTTVLVVGVAMPTPGAIGGFHAAYQIAVQTFFAAPTDRAVGGAIVLHAISFLPVTMLGIFFMAREGLTLSGARALAADTDQSANVRECQGAKVPECPDAPESAR